MTPPHHDQDLRAALLGQLLDELRHQGLVAGRLARHADHMHVVLDRLRARLPPASGTAGRYRRRSRGRRRPWRSPWRRGRGRPGPSSRPSDAAGGLLPRRRPRSRCGCAPAPRRPPTRWHRRRRSSGWWPGSGHRRLPAPTEISPTVARARVASIDSVSRLPVPLRAASPSAFSAATHLASSRLARILLQARDLRLAHHVVVDIEDLDRRALPSAGTC